MADEHFGDCSILSDTGIKIDLQESPEPSVRISNCLLPAQALDRDNHSKLHNID